MLPEALQRAALDEDFILSGSERDCFGGHGRRKTENEGNEKWKKEKRMLFAQKRS